jgi:hypothetical protein
MRGKLVAVLALSMLWGFCMIITSPHISADSSSGNIVVQTVPGDKLSDRFVNRAKSSWPWYLTRASGLVAAGCLIVLLLSGIGQITGQTFRFLDPLTSWASHRALGIAFSISALVHILSLLFDHFVPFNIWQVLVPWLSDYRPVHWFGVNIGSIWVAAGVFAMYLVALIMITSLVWVEKKPYLWKLIHYLSYVTILLVFVHALYIGTDLAHGLWRWLWVFANLVIFAAVLSRLWRARTI